jgi:hypothetical protein
MSPTCDRAPSQRAHRDPNANCITIDPATSAQSPHAIIGTLIPALHAP